MNWPAHARARGWDQVRLLSCGDSTFKYDLGSEDADGGQESTVSVFTLGRDGSPRHSYTARPYLSDDIDQRGIDLLTPAWHVLDLTRATRLRPLAAGLRRRRPGWASDGDLHRRP